MKVTLDGYRSKGCKVFSGHDRGRMVATHIKETYGDDVEIEIPDDVYCISHTFSQSFNEILPNKLDWEAEIKRRMKNRKQ